LIVRDTALSSIRMAADSIDLRPKILRACERPLGSQRRIADVFGVSRAFVENVWRQHRTTGDIAPKPPAGGQQPRLDTAAQAVVRRLVADHPEATVAEWCARVAAARGVRVSVPTMCRVLQRLGLPRKKRRAPRRNAIPRAPNRRGRFPRSGSRRATASACSAWATRA
jgi:transposase